MQEKPTPGPWYSLSGKEGTVELSNSAGPRWSSPDHYVGSVLARNAPLIKAAPDLLEAAVIALKWLETSEANVIGDTPWEEIEKLEAAIKKARGI